MIRDFNGGEKDLKALQARVVEKSIKELRKELKINSGEFIC